MEERDLDLQQEVHMGHKAKVLLEELEPYFKIMEAQLINAIYTCSVSDIDTLHNIKIQLHGLKSLQQNVQQVIDTGKLASAELKGELDE